MASNFVHCAILGVWLAFFLIGMHNYVLNNDANRCQMTYMFEHPQYVNLPLKPSVKSKFPKYKLFLYGEGEYADAIRATGYSVSGIPILFIPGSDGSHKQVRSLASIALRRAEFKRSNFHFNYFSVDFNDEYSGVYGGVLEEQTKFVVESIKHIRKIYSKVSSTPKSIILVGHSMGGVIAQAIFAEPKFDAASVHTILTQATPHRQPVINLDSSLSNFYQKIDAFWQENIDKSLKNVVLISVGGGFNDLLVKNSLVQAKDYKASGRILSTSTVAVPKVWMTTDHRAIVWCKQFVLATQRSLFEMVDKKTNRISEDVKIRLPILKHHFLDHSGSELLTESKHILLDPKVQMLDINERTFGLKQEPLKEKAYISMDLSVITGQNFMAMCRNCEDTWILGCVQMDKDGKCIRGYDLSPSGRLQPPEAHPRKIIHLSNADLNKYTSLILVVPKTEWSLEMRAELYSQVDRHINITLPAFLSNFPASLYKFTTVLSSTVPGALFYNLSIPEFETYRQAFKVKVKRTGCYDVSKEHEETFQHHVPWSREDSFATSNSNYGTNGTLKYQTAMPAGWVGPLSQLHIFLDSDCLYEVQIRLSIPDILGNCLRNYGPLLPSFIVVNIILSLSWQLATLENDCHSLLWHFNLMKDGTHPLRLLPFVVIPHLILASFPDVKNFIYSTGLPLFDGHYRDSSGITAWPTNDMMIFPNLFFLSNCLATVFATGGLIVVRILSMLLGLVVRRFIASTFVTTCAEIAYILFCLLALLAVVTTCGGAGLLIINIICLMKVIWLNIKGTLGGEQWHRNRARVHFSLLLLTSCLTILAGPSLVTWYKNLEFDIIALDNDPWRLVGCGICLAQIIISLIDNPRLYSHSSMWTYRTLHFTAILIPFYALTSLYQLPYFITFVFLLISLRCLRSITYSNGTSTPESERKTKKNQ